MKSSAKKNRKSVKANGNVAGRGMPSSTGRSVREISDLPFRSFAALKEAVAGKKFSIGVDPLAAARWSAEFNAGPKKTLVSALSVLLIVAAVASVVVAIAFENYWLLLALPIQIVVFFLSNTNTSLSLWVTVAGGVSLLFFFDLLLNRLPTAATLVAYAGLTFACVRAANSVTNNAFRKALTNDEDLFVEAYLNGACTLRDTDTKEVYEYDDEENEDEEDEEVKR